MYHLEAILYQLLLLPLLSLLNHCYRIVFSLLFGVRSNALASVGRCSPLLLNREIPHPNAKSLPLQISIASNARGRV